METMQKQYLKKHPKAAEPRRFSEGDYVLVLNIPRRKLEPKWIGPFTVRSAYHEFDSYQLVLPSGQIWPVQVHGDRMRPIALDEEPDHLWYYKGIPGDEPEPEKPIADRDLTADDDP
ncbi:hypothetical protein CAUPRSCDRAFT_12934 [Caulochytrium protostelioides]|uniref:Uncharacterized protein n=1 Tax=Caulochytrium protostelioides TaxID=1555241 RepID=A0A4V1IT04_9FUNG|nr:hypothetical protein CAUPRSCDRAFT_12934 [Caulochytrium protostelioides]